jgi:DNA-binding transcriptional regulator LsrR (DeoR family)
MESAERLATVCDYICYEGLSATEITKRMKAEHSEKMTREEPYRLFRKAAGNGWIRFNPPPAYAQQRQLKDEHRWLQDVSVVQTARYENVAYRGAEMLLELLQQHYAGKEVHIGFSGGYALRTLARRFAELLREPAKHLPDKIVFHALVAGFDVNDPTTDPNAFFTYFVGDPAMQVKTSFVALHAPAVVEPELLPRLRAQRGIDKAYRKASEINIIVTSTSCWQDEDSMLRNYMKVAGESAGELEKAGCLGDMLWQPIGPDGPIELETAIRAMTITELGDVSRFVREKNQVLLVAGPCATCHRPKTEVVKAILDQDDPLITHLVVDSRCARDLHPTR